MYKKNDKKKITILGLSIWRIFAYFIIYSILGYIIETIFALLVYGVLESRKSFLYGPFCSIYGVGAVLMILFLRYFNKNGYTLFIFGFIIGSIVEYIMSLLGEIILKVRWWDYSDKFLNINGRICFTYSLFWGILAIYLMRGINPQIDKFINYLKKKLNVNFLRTVASTMTIFLILDCIISGYAISQYLIRQIAKNNLDVENKEQVIQIYNNIGKDKKMFIEKYFSDEKMVKTYPNLKISLIDGTVVHIKDLLPNIKPYYYKFNK